MTPLLQVTGLTRHYGRIVALDALSFSVHEGEILGLIGPNGAGKTTVFECLGGVRPADQLAITHLGKSLAATDLNSVLFYLPDAITPWPAQSVSWALDYTLGLFGGRRDLREDVVRSLDLSSLLERPLGKLSKGQRKRALLAIGLLTPQPVLIAEIGRAHV